MKIFHCFRKGLGCGGGCPIRAGLAAFPLRIDRYAIVLVFLAQVLFFPYFPKMNSANELSRLYLALAMVENRNFEITPFISRFGNINDKSVIRDTVTVDGKAHRSERFYSDKPPGTALVAAPAIALRHLVAGFTCLRGDMRLARLFVCILPTLLLLGLMRREMEELGVGSPVRAIAILGYGLGTLAMPYSVTYLAHQPVAVMLYAIWFLLRRRPEPPSLKAAAGAGFLAGFCLMTEYQAAVYLLPLAVLFLVRVRPLARGLPVAIAAAAIPLAFLAFYHHQSFGGVLQTGYNHIANPFFASVHQKGFMGVLYPGWTQFAGSFFLPSKGLFVFSPFLLLGFVGIVSYFRVAGRIDGAFRLAQILLPALFVSSMVYWDGGWTVGQRHLTPMIPFLIAPAALLMQRSLAAGIAAPGLVGASIMYTGLATVVYPHLPENIPNPFHDLTIPLFKGGCLAQVFVLTELPSYAVLWVLAAVIFLALALAAVLRFVSSSEMPRPGARRIAAAVAAVILLAAIPAGWYGWTSQVARLDSAAAAKHRVYFEDQCRAAGRWNDVDPDAGQTCGE
ncbi:MAG TPA: hypothetical protein PKH54_01910 [Myxococcota bacterium]|nr:hypothetical protein [Myxococcota bacterium]